MIPFFVPMTSPSMIWQDTSCKATGVVVVIKIKMVSRLQRREKTSPGLGNTHLLHQWRSPARPWIHQYRLTDLYWSHRTNANHSRTHSQVEIAASASLS
ncbi:hypothetical protein BDR04DRAFT_601153 [Suillus decipiens]|nr:hypothetical protein BDR04DRAFT_601153 [Suillus decipiens]